MSNYVITKQLVGAYGDYLRAEERAKGTIAKYTRDVERFAAWLCGRAVTKERTTEWKEQLAGFAPQFLSVRRMGELPDKSSSDTKKDISGTKQRIGKI